MRILTILLSLLLVTPVFAAEDLSHITNAGGTVYFSDDMEDGTAYRGSGNAHSGGGYYSALGGTAVTGSVAADPCNASYTTEHVTHISDDVAANESTYSMKTPYDGDCVTESFTRDTTTIAFGSSVYEGYIRWYQMWTGDWNSASAQHKFTKVYIPGTGGTLAAHFSFSGGEVWKNFMPNVDDRFYQDGYTSPDWVWVHHTDASGPTYNGDLDRYDDINNGIDGGNDGEFTFNTNQWYCLELHYKINSDATTSDAEVHAWIDGTLVFQVENFKFYPNVDRATRFGPTTIELQHIYYNRSATDQPTYMDNIVIADQYIGTLGSSPPTTQTSYILRGVTYQ